MRTTSAPARGIAAPFRRLRLGGVAAGLACLATAACVPPAPQPSPQPSPPPAAPAPTPPPPPPPPPPPTVMAPPADQQWMDAPQTPGDWRHRPSPTSRASFGQPGGAPLFEVVCENGGQVLLLRQGTGGPAMRILTETAERTLPAVTREGATVAQLSAQDPLLDAMAFSKGRFAIEIAGLGTLYLPSWPEVTRVIEDCR